MRQTVRCLALFVLVAFLANVAAWGGGAAQMAHALGHGAGPSAQREFVEAGDDSAAAVTEHQALHAVDHMHLFPPTPAHLAFARALEGRALVMFVAHPLPPARADLPFRPPRQRA